MDESVELVELIEMPELIELVELDELVQLVDLIQLVELVELVELIELVLFVDSGIRVKYQPIGTGGTRSPSAMLHGLKQHTACLIQNGRWGL